MSDDAHMLESIRQSLVLANGAKLLEEHYALRGNKPQAQFEAEREELIAAIAIDYGPEFNERECRYQLFDNAELAN